MLFYQGGQRQPQLCPVTHKSQYFPIGSWVAGARVRFLPKETQQQPRIDPGHRTWNLAITRLMPRPLCYYCPYSK